MRISRPEPIGTTPRERRHPRLVLALGLGGLVAAALAAGTALRDPTGRLLDRRSRLASVVEGPAERSGGYWVQSVRLRATSGLEVDLLLKRPVEDGELAAAPPVGVPRPLVVLLGGHVTGRDAVRLIPETRGALVAALSYPYRGEHRLKGLQIVRHVPAIRRAVLDTPAAVMLAFDYLLARPDVDARRAEAVGVSLGAPFMVIAGALDPRITRVWSVHGSGGVYGPLEANLRHNIPFAPARAAVAGLATLLIGPQLAPERWVPRIAPRPFVMLNAREDEQMPRPLVDRLYARAGAPKAQIWMPGGHVRARPELVRPIVDTVLARIAAAP